MEEHIEKLKTTINKAYEDPDFKKNKEYHSAIQEVIDLLNQGIVRVAERISVGNWKTNEWIKKAIILYFRIEDMKTITAGDLVFYDKIPVRIDHQQRGVRVVPHGLVRYGAYVEKGVVMMPSYVNIGAYVDTGTMIDTWATVGSCAQIGKNVHLSGGVGIGGVLEPPQATPVIIEDNAFIGSRAIIVEGVIVEERAVIGAGVILTASTPIIDVTQEKEVIYRGRVPANSVVIPGTRVKKFPAGEYGTPCALIIGKRKTTTDEKTSLNEALRDFEVPV
ncbi:MAG: 2,3,4,5-tetrahydropyridine-2,6-dicarboxylate N-succinyltransferase [Leptospiraceae bacterium]|nr:2,3,4,5-tetrahydropyridine-2,6-dicarboxylate N-succinyltransferase [Leptospiraceae bacterium]MDW7975209.1 2,3,4,5-tetrahydropyridine-2,6-dicarboxylate N-succinyltransferase [Leptospiraceae bacterium]